MAGGTFMPPAQRADQGQTAIGRCGGDIILYSRQPRRCRQSGSAPAVATCLAQRGDPVGALPVIDGKIGAHFPARGQAFSSLDELIANVSAQRLGDLQRE